MASPTARTPAQRERTTAGRPLQSTTDQVPRCTSCGRALAAHLTRPWALRCRKCGAPNARS